MRVMRMQSPGDVARFDRFARHYERLVPASDARPIRAGLALADRDIDRVLDVGGGTGRAVRALGIPERIVVDAAPGMLAEARRRGLCTVRGDAARLPFADASVDAVLIVDALHHVADQTGALAEAERSSGRAGCWSVASSTARPSSDSCSWRANTSSASTPSSSPPTNSPSPSNALG